MALLFFKDPGHPEGIPEEIRRRVPDLQVRVFPETGNLKEVRYLLAYAPSPEFLSQLERLELIFSTGAGADVLLRSPNRPDVPVIRMVDAGLSRLVAHYVLAHALAWLRDSWHYRARQAQAAWDPQQVRGTDGTRVGMLGLGAIGREAAAALRGVGFDLAGWSRTKKGDLGFPCFHGADGLDQVLSRSEILVSVLPHTPSTAELLNYRTLGRLPRGAVVINVGRGANLVEQDLIALLDENHLRGATLDVFQDEPLPASHPFWRHPGIVVTPHVAGVISASGMAGVVATELARFRSGERLKYTVDPANGY